MSNPDPASVPVYLMRDGCVQIGDFVFVVVEMRTLNVMDNHIDHTQTVDLQLTLARRIDKAVDKT